MAGSRKGAGPRGRRSRRQGNEDGRWNGRVVIEVAPSTTSGRDLDFLKAMVEGSGPSSTLDIGRRTGLRPNAVGDYAHVCFTSASSRQLARGLLISQF